MINTTNLSELVRGAAELEPTERGVRPHRLSARARGRFPDQQLLAMESQPSGVRLEFSTTATWIELVLHPTRLAYRGADRPRGCIDVMIDGALAERNLLSEGDLIEVDLQTGAAEERPGPSHSSVLRQLPPGEKQVEIWLPHNETIELLALRSDAPLGPSQRTLPVWVHHGSSISHGSNASAPTQIWPVVAARRSGVDLHNLGFGGSALVDQFLAREIRDMPADLISLKLGINVVNLDAMRLRAFVPAVLGFLDTVRDGHPSTPLILISPIFCAIHEDTPGPGAVDPASLGTDQVRFTATGTLQDTAQGRLTLTVIRRELEALVSRLEDPNLRYLDGTRLYGPADAIDLPLPDALHPSTEAHQLIGDRFADYALTPATAALAHGLVNS